jgi:hypothetical protein
VTTSEFKQWPTGIDTTSLDQTNIGNQAAQDVALTLILQRASAWVDDICKVDSLATGTYTETKEMHAGRDGRFNVFTRNAPIQAVTSVQYKTSPQQPFTPVTLSTNVQPFYSWFTIYSLNNGLFLDTYYPQFYYSPYSLSRLSDTPIILQYTYTAGYATIPDPVKQATILLASFLIRERGSYSVTMNESSISGISNAYTKTEDVDMAKALLKPYVRTVTS